VTRIKADHHKIATATFPEIDKHPQRKKEGKRFISLFPVVASQQGYIIPVLQKIMAR